MSVFEHLGAALRLLRIRAGLDQVEVSARAGISNSIVNRVENGRSEPTINSLDAILRASGATLRDLADALDEVEHGPLPPNGAPRAEWVAALLRHGVDQRVLAGLAIGTRLDADSAADLLASAREAAAQLAREVIEEVQSAEARLEVAEPAGSYDARRGKR